MKFNYWFIETRILDENFVESSYWLFWDNSFCFTCKWCSWKLYWWAFMSHIPERYKDINSYKSFWFVVNILIWSGSEMTVIFLWKTSQRNWKEIMDVCQNKTLNLGSWNLIKWIDFYVIKLVATRLLTQSKVIIFIQLNYSFEQDNFYHLSHYFL